MTINREEVFNKYSGKCAYSGTLLADDWQVDHLIPADENGIKNDDISNLLPAQKIINHYKRSLSLEDFRTWYMAGLHERLGKLPKNPKAIKSIKRKKYLLKVASYFSNTKTKAFSGKFYFEGIEK